MKTLVACAHATGPHENGYDNCYGRASAGGLCPGVYHANFLNNLGPDAELYLGSTRTTNGEVRENYLRGNFHVIAVEPHLAAASAEVRRLSAELRRAKSKLQRLQKVKIAGLIHQR